MYHLIIRFFLAQIGLLALMVSTSPAYGSEAWGLNDLPHDESSAEELFNNRIMPIFRSPNPSSCVQCHLSSVDLKNYILPSHEKTFLSLRDQGLIDLDHPEKSKILELIQMGERDYDKGASLIHKDMREAEYQAFAAWIKASCKDQTLRSLPQTAAETLAQPSVPVEVIRHGRKGRVMNSFVRNVWSQRMRCFPCHTPHEIKPNQEKALANFEEWERNYGSDRMTIFQESPLETIKYLVEKSKSRQRDGELPMLDLENPQHSLLVLKPTSKLPPKVDGEIGQPTYQQPIYHMGGLKMHKDDQSYKSFIAWIKDYSNVVGDQYQSIDDLPEDNWHATQNILRIKDMPESIPVGTPIQLFVHRRIGDSVNWSDEPVAFTQGTITPRHIANGALFLLSPTEPEKRQAWNRRKSKLPAGQYLIKVYADTEGKLAEDPSRFLDPSDCIGQVVLENAKWQIGFPKAEMISASKLDQP